MATTTRQSSNRVAEYKGRKYRLLWLGNTKYSRRAHLQFFSGDKDFWVDASLVEEVESQLERFDRTSTIQNAGN